MHRVVTITVYFISSSLGGNEYTLSTRLEQACGHMHPPVYSQTPGDAAASRRLYKRCHGMTTDNECDKQVSYPQVNGNSPRVQAAGVHAVHLALVHMVQDLLTEQVRGAVGGGAGQDVAGRPGPLDLLDGLHHSDCFACFESRLSLL